MRHLFMDVRYLEWLPGTAGDMQEVVVVHLLDIFVPFFALCSWEPYHDHSPRSLFSSELFSDLCIKSKPSQGKPSL